ncbi:SpaA isopeptide-forming pilin-related protein [Peptoniphilaceae bacterium SGI.131]
MRKKTIFSKFLALLLLITFLQTSPVKASENLELKDCTVGADISERLTNIQTDTQLKLKDSLGLTSYILTQYAAAVNNLADQPIKKGEYFTVKVDEKLRFQGIISPQQYTVPPLQQVLSDGSTEVIGDGYFDNTSNTITYVFNKDISGDQLTLYFMGAWTVNEKVILNNGNYDFTIEYPGKTENLNYNVVMDNGLGELTNNFQGQNIKTKTSWQLVNIDPVNKSYLRYILFELSNKDEIADTSKLPNFGFYAGTSSVPYAATTNIRIFKAPASINDSLYYDTATLEEVTDQFQITDDPINPSTKIFKSNLPMDSGFYIVDEGLYISNDENFVGSLTPILLDKDGNEISQVKLDATSTLVKESMQAMAQVINTSSCKPHKILEITKLDEKTGKTLAGAKFKISNPDGSLVEELVTDESGKASLRLLLGKYSIQETDAPNGYILNSEAKEIDLNSEKEKIVSLSFKNTPEETEPEKPKPEEPKPEEPKPEEPKPEEPKPETPKPEVPKPEEPKPENPNSSSPKTGDIIADRFLLTTSLVLAGLLYLVLNKKREINK